MTTNEIRKVLDFEFKPIVDLLMQLVTLKDMERECIVLVDLNGMSEEQVAERFDISRGTVNNHRKRAIQKISKAWNGNPLVELILRSE